MGPHLGLVGLGALLLGGVLMVAVPDRRRGLVASVVVTLICLVLTGVDSLLGHVGGGALFRGFATYGVGAALITILCVGAFHVLLPALRVSTTGITRDVSALVAHVAWVFISLRRNGVELTSLVTTSAVLTAVIGFSLQDTLGNVLGGLFLQIDRSVQVGDWILLDDVNGQVVEIRWRYTAVQTRNWETVIIPNSVLLKNRFRVAGRRVGAPQYWRRQITFNVDFRFPPVTVLNAVQTGLRSAQIPNVAEDPQPQCILARFTDSVAEYQARYWLTNVGQDEATDSEVRQRIFLALRRAGIPLSVPAQSVFLTQESAERQHRKEKRSIAARVQALQEIELFHSLTDEELHQLAEHLASFPFAPGDIITRQGDTDHWLYIVIEGQASVELAAPGGPPRVLAELGPGDFFGEMALLLGEPRRATVVARTPLESFRLDKQVFELVVQSRPEVAGEISRVLAHRRTELEAAEEHLGAEAHAARVNTMQGQILERIRSFFSLG